MKQKTWFALDISVDTNAVEAIEFALNELDSAGTEIEVRGLNQIIENTTVIGCFEEKPTDEIVNEHLAEALRIYGFDKSAIKQMSWREVENKDWLAEWKKSWKPTETSQFIIAPVWAEVVTNRAEYGFRHGNARNNQTLPESNRRLLRKRRNFFRCRNRHRHFSNRRGNVARQK
jgi:ribosomal protein L11 methylase PrmA